ncbi:MAG: hypothetical protein KA796_06555 [Chryseobacterium sp.]|nr:hypothetical protein [Chryseobacterium sp.]MBP7499514.1 hypothetical protein [Chryseobacterium sp.]
MNKEILEHINNIYKQTSRLTYKTIEQCKADFEPELKAISKIFGIADLEAIFLLSIIINNAEYKNCQIEDIANSLDVSKFEVLENLDKFISLQSKKLIEISEPNDSEQENHRYSHKSKFPITIMNKIFKITEETEFQIFSKIL